MANSSTLYQDKLKQKAAEAALAYLGDHTIIGVGSGTTVNYFIQALSLMRHRLDGCVAASIATEARLREAGIPVVALSVAEPLGLYIDGADEVTSHRSMIKGGGGALTREKILATVAREFICLVDESKSVHRLGACPVPVEVIPLARGFVARELVKLGGQPVYREQCVTDNGNVILDVFHLDLTDPVKMEKTINQITGVVENGIFANRLADRVIIARDQGILVLP